MRRLVSDGLTIEDYEIYRRLPLARLITLNEMIRHDYRADLGVMQARTLASSRGATPVDVQRNVLALDSDEYPIQCKIGVRS